MTHSRGREKKLLDNNLVLLYAYSAMTISVETSNSAVSPAATPPLVVIAPQGAADMEMFLAKTREDSAAYHRQWMEKNRDRVAAQKRAWVAANKTRTIEYQRQWHLDNRTSILAKNHERYQAQRDEDNAQSRRFRAEHPEYMFTYNQLYYLVYRDVRLQENRVWPRLHPDRARAIKRKWGKLHPESLAFHACNRRVRKLNAMGTHTTEEWRRSCSRWENRCLCCGDTRRPTKDHIVPLSRGGTNSLDNLQLLCLSCNSRKGTKTTDYRTNPKPLALPAQQEA